MYSSYLPIGFVVTGVTNMLYHYHTRSDGIIHVNDKYSYNRVYSNSGHIRSSQQFTIIDKDEKLYTIPYSVLSLQFDAEDKWSKMMVGKSDHITYWGICQPLLGLYPRIDGITEVQSDSPKVL